MGDTGEPLQRLGRVLGIGEDLGRVLEHVLDGSGGLDTGGARQIPRTWWERRAGGRRERRGEWSYHPLQLGRVLHYRC